MIEHLKSSINDENTVAKKIFLFANCQTFAVFSIMIEIRAPFFDYYAMDIIIKRIQL